MGTGATPAAPYFSVTQSSAPVRDTGQNLAKPHSTTGLTWSFGYGPHFDGGSVDSLGHGSVAFRNESTCDDSESVCVTDDITNESEGDLLQLTIVTI